MIRVKLCIPAYADLTDGCRQSLQKLISAGNREGFLFTLDIRKGCYLYALRNILIGETWCVEEAVANAGHYDLIWFIDSDISGYTVDMLKSIHKHICDGEVAVAIPYCPKDDPDHLVAGKFSGDCTNTHPYLTCGSHESADWTGFGCIAFPASVFTETLSFPWFYPEVVEYHDDKGKRYLEVCGEDIAFCRRLYKEEIPVYLIRDYGVLDHGV